MNIERKYTLKEKQLERSLKEIEKLKSQIEDLETENKLLKHENTRLETAVKEFQPLKEKWTKEIEIFKNKRAEYDILIYQLKILQKKLRS